MYSSVVLIAGCASSPGRIGPMHSTGTQTNRLRLTLLRLTNQQVPLLQGSEEHAVNLKHNSMQHRPMETPLTACLWLPRI